MGIGLIARFRSTAHVRKSVIVSTLIGSKIRGSIVTTTFKLYTRFHGESGEVGWWKNVNDAQKKRIRLRDTIHGIIYNIYMHKLSITASNIFTARRKVDAATRCSGACSTPQLTWKGLLNDLRPHSFVGMGKCFSPPTKNWPGNAGYPCP